MSVTWYILWNISLVPGHYELWVHHWGNGLWSWTSWEHIWPSSEHSLRANIQDAALRMWGDALAKTLMQSSTLNRQLNIHVKKKTSAQSPDPTSLSHTLSFFCSVVHLPCSTTTLKLILVLHRLSCIVLSSIALLCLLSPDTLPCNYSIKFELYSSGDVWKKHLKPEPQRGMRILVQEAVDTRLVWSKRLWAKPVSHVEFPAERNLQFWVM